MPGKVLRFNLDRAEPTMALLCVVSNIDRHAMQCIQITKESSSTDFYLEYRLASAMNKNVDSRIAVAL